MSLTSHGHKIPGSPDTEFDKGRFKGRCGGIWLCKLCGDEARSWHKRNGTPVKLTDPPKHERLDWHRYGIGLAKAAATRADCTRRQVGAVLMLKDRSISVTGYNGGPSGGPSCLAGECPRGLLTHEELPADSPYDSGGGTCIALHAEWNVLLRSSWQNMTGATLYITEEPCHLCYTLIRGTKIARVVFLRDGEMVIQSISSIKE